jgi:hypothetical protein
MEISYLPMGALFVADLALLDLVTLRYLVRSPSDY